MKTIDNFVNNLSVPKKDIVNHILNDLINDCHPGRVEKLERQLNDLKEQIDRTNNKREGLKQRLQEIQEIHSALSVELNSNGSSSDLLILKMLLDDAESYLKEEIEVLRPTHRLKQKSDLTKFIYRLKQRKSISDVISQKVGMNNGG